VPLQLGKLGTEISLTVRTSGQQLKRLIQARANSERTEIAAVACQDAVDFATLGDRRYRPVNQPEVELSVFCIKFQGPGNIGR